MSRSAYRSCVCCAGVHVRAALAGTRWVYGPRATDRARGTGHAGGGAVGTTRRSVLMAAGAAAAVATIATAGQTVPWLRRVSVLAPRSGDGPQGLPVNRTALAAGVLRSARSPEYRLTVVGAGATKSFTLADLRAMPQATRELPIACVEGWSATATWTGIVLADLVSAVGGSPNSDVRMISLEAPGPYSRTTLPARHARDAATLIALQLNGADLDVDHGYPCRLIAPTRPGVLQTKWLSRIEVVA